MTFKTLKVGSNSRTAMQVESFLMRKDSTLSKGLNNKKKKLLKKENNMLNQKNNIGQKKKKDKNKSLRKLKLKGKTKRGTRYYKN